MTVTSLLARFRRRYGASPLHLLGHLVAFAIVVFAFGQIFGDGDVKELLVWFLGFVVVHDLIFLPAYTGLDRLARTALLRLPTRGSREVPMINHLRAPALVSGVLLIIYAPLISGRAEIGYFALSGHHLVGYLRNWLLITAALFVGSGGIYALRVGLRPAQPSTPESDSARS